MAFGRNPNGTFWTYNGKCLIVSSRPAQRVSVDNGGRLKLSTGDTLIIEPSYSEGAYEEGLEGLVFYLESGEGCSGYYYSSADERVYSSIYGFIGGLGSLYDEGDVFRIYTGDLYHKDGYCSEEQFRIEYEEKPTITLQIINGYWEELRIEPYHQEFKANDNDIINIYGNAFVHSETGVYFTTQTGDDTIAFYGKNNYGCKQETGYNWFGEVIPEEGDEIIIFKGNYYDIDEIQEKGYQEQYDTLIGIGDRPILITYYDGTKGIDIT